MVSSKCGRLLVAAGLPAAAAGLALGAAGAASAAPVALPVVHAVKITTDVSCEGRPAIVSPQAHTPEYARPGALPVVVDTVRPVDSPKTHTAQITTTQLQTHTTQLQTHTTQLQTHVVECARPGALPVVESNRRPEASVTVKVPKTRPEHPVLQHGVIDPLAAEKHAMGEIHMYHQTVILKIETTVFGDPANQGFMRGN